jgi:hypothetical protein
MLGSGAACCAMAAGNAVARQTANSADAALDRTYGCCLLILALPKSSPLRRFLLCPRSLRGRRCVGCKVSAAVYFSPLSCRVSRYSAAKSSKTSRRWGHFSLRRFLPRRLLAAAILSCGATPRQSCQSRAASDRSRLSAAGESPPSGERLCILPYAFPGTARRSDQCSTAPPQKCPLPVIHRCHCAGLPAFPESISAGRAG